MSEKKQKIDGQSPAVLFVQKLEELERITARRAYGELFTPLNQILGKLETQEWTFGGRFTAVTTLSESHATRLASVVTSFIVDPSYSMQKNVFHMLCRFKRTLSQVFEVSGYRGTGHFERLVGEPDSKNPTQMTFRRSDLPKLFAVISINSLTPQMLDFMMQMDRNLSFSLLLGFLSEQMLYTQQAENMRSQLLSRADHWIGMTPELLQLQSIGPAYMGCSYAVAEHKHDIKRAFNAVCKRWLEEQGVKDRPLPSVRAIKSRPTVVIFAEFYHELHAMHRCYGPSISALREKFHTVLMVPKGSESQALTDIVDEVHSFEFQLATVKQLVDKIVSFEPDMFYMPSVGMRLSSILLSTLRLAPIQLMTFGHPATTKSKAVDYAVLAEDQIGALKTIDETVLMRPAGKRHGLRSDAKPIPANIRHQPDTVKIAVPAWSRKLTPAFLDACQYIQKNAKRKVEFVFFPNSVGSLHQMLCRRYDEMLNCTVLPRTDYNSYIEALNECDIFLSSFPFGATNGILDASAQGLPIVNVRGPEVHTFNDSHLVARINQPKWLTTNNVDAFIKAVLKLVNDDSLRVQISRNILDGNPSEAFHVDETEVPRDMAEVFEGVYYLHEQIQASGAKAAHHKELKHQLALKVKKMSAAQ